MKNFVVLDIEIGDKDIKKHHTKSIVYNVV